MKIHGNRINHARKLFDKERKQQGRAYWRWLQKKDGSNYKRLSKKNANKFLFACCIDYQEDADGQWDKAELFIERDLRDPANLWNKLSKYNWRSLRKKYKYLHRFPQAHKRICRIARSIVNDFHGDARDIWKEKDPAIARERLESIRFGEQLTQIVIGALLDAKKIKGTGDVKADLNVKRVLGRIFKGKLIDEDESVNIGRMVYRRNPWKADSVLFFHGQYICQSHPI